MFRRSLYYCALVVPLLSCVLLLPIAAETPQPIRIGMVQTFFHDIPQPLIDLATEPFGTVMREATGLQGQLNVKGDAFHVADRLYDGSFQLGVFHGQEFAWAKEKYPTLRPLMVAVNENRLVQAYILTRKESTVKKFSDLKGKDFSIPKKSKEHCRLFVERSCQTCGLSSTEFFQKIIPSIHVENALDELTRGKVDAVVVDRMGLEFYRDLKPGCYSALKIALTSEPFPHSVIAYREGGLDQPTLNRLRDGLVNAHTRTTGREMMKLWRVQGFEVMPGNYNSNLTDILKAYPSPESLKLSLR